MGWRQQIDQVQDQLFAFDRDLKQLDGLLWQFKNDSSQLNLPDPVKGFISGCIGDLDGAVRELRHVFDTLFLPVVEPDVSRDFLEYIRGVHAHHQALMQRFEPVTTAFFENYQPPAEHAQYHESVPYARADMRNMDVALGEHINNLDAMIHASENFTGYLVVALGALLIAAAAVAVLVATALLSAPASGPAAIGGAGTGGVAAASAEAANITFLAQLGAVINTAVPFLTWQMAAGAAVILGAAGVTIELSPKVRREIEDILKHAEDRPSDNPDSGDNPNPKPYIDPFPFPRPPDTKTKQPCGKDDWVTFAVKLSPAGDPTWGAKYVESIVKAHGDAEACYILRELTDIYAMDAADPALDSSGLTTIEHYLRQGDSSTWFAGAFFELQWLHDHGGITAIEPTLDGFQGPDALGVSTYGPTVIDFKSVQTAQKSTLLAQAQRFQSMYKYPPNTVLFIFDEGKMTPDEIAKVQSWFDTGKFPPGVKCTFWKPEWPTQVVTQGSGDDGL